MARQGGRILVLNCGSSSIKWALFATAPHGVPRAPSWRGEVRGLGAAAAVYSEAGMQETPLAAVGEAGRQAALAHVLDRARARLGSAPLAALAHRVVHGGSAYGAPVRVNASVLDALRALVPLAPLHQPLALDALEASLARWPGVPHIACFDTAFHHGLPRVEQMLPLPHGLGGQGLRRYGFHGLSYDYMSVVLPERHGPRAQGRVIVAHLGNGASLCAMQGLRSVATTMGFSPLDGLMMGTRCGTLDPGVLLYLLEDAALTPAQLGRLLYQESGLLGVSGLSSDPRVLLASEGRGGEAGARAHDALALYVRRIVREIGALVAVLGGLDLLVFTAGVGQHCAEIRRRVCDGLGFLGLALDADRNAAAAAVISSAASPVLVGVEPANEEWIAARQALSVLAAGSGVGQA